MTCHVLRVIKIKNLNTSTTKIGFYYNTRFQFVRMPRVHSFLKLN